MWIFAAGLRIEKQGAVDDRRQHALEPLARPCPCGGSSAETIGDSSMRLGPRMAGDEADDPLDLRGLEPEAGIPAAAPEAVEPEPTVGIDHDLDDLGVGERGRDRRPHRRAEHRAAAGGGKRLAHGRRAALAGAPPSVRVLPAIASPTRATKALKRSRPTARAASSPSASGACTVSW